MSREEVWRLENLSLVWKTWTEAAESSNEYLGFVSVSRVEKVLNSDSDETLPTTFPFLLLPFSYRHAGASAFVKVALKLVTFLRKEETFMLLSKVSLFTHPLSFLSRTK